MASKTKQDMPPKGGYGPIEFARVIKKSRISGYSMFAGFAVLSIGAIAAQIHDRRKKRALELEMKDARVALQPLVVAERQRMFLRQLRKNRDEENELMKNVPGWETGTYYGKPVYHNLSDRFHVVHGQEYFIHNTWNDMYDRIYERLNH